MSLRPVSNGLERLKAAREGLAAEVSIEVTEDWPLAAAHVRVRAGGMVGGHDH